MTATGDSSAGAEAENAGASGPDGDADASTSASGGEGGTSGDDGSAGEAGQSGSGGSSGDGAEPSSENPDAGMMMEEEPAEPPCVPAVEVCDAMDNDCDGMMDEMVTRPCGPEMPRGECKAGVDRCVAGMWTGCMGAVEPAMEVCDEAKLDENCDGRPNDGCDCVMGETQECGTDEGVCRKGMQTCMDGQWGTECEGKYDPMMPEVCDQAMQDENCDGEANPGCECYVGQSPRPCPGGVDTGECNAGTQTCNNGRWSACSGGRGPQTETCDGDDDNCNGTDDDDPSDCRSPLMCRNGRCDECSGNDEEPCEADGMCVPPTRSCTNGQWGECTGGTRCEQGETCRNARCEECMSNTSEPCEDARACGMQPTRTCTNGRWGTCSGGNFCDTSSGEECVDGQCQVPQAPCGNEVWDPEEECDPSVSGWSEVCDSDCTFKLYKPCSSAGAACGDGGICANYQVGSEIILMCAPQCASASDCPAVPNRTNECVFVACALYCSGGCPDGMRCETVADYDYNGAFEGDKAMCVR